MTFKCNNNNIWKILELSAFCKYTEKWYAVIIYFTLNFKFKHREQMLLTSNTSSNNSTNNT